MSDEQQWREACEKAIPESLELYAIGGLVDYIRTALDLNARGVGPVLWYLEHAGACVRAMRGDDASLYPVEPHGVHEMLLYAMQRALWSDDPYGSADEDDLSGCESWLYSAWKALRDE